MLFISATSPPIPVTPTKIRARSDTPRNDETLMNLPLLLQQKHNKATEKLNTHMKKGNPKQMTEEIRSSRARRELRMRQTRVFRPPRPGFWKGKIGKEGTLGRSRDGKSHARSWTDLHSEKLRLHQDLSPQIVHFTTPTHTHTHTLSLGVTRGPRRCGLTGL